MQIFHRIKKTSLKKHGNTQKITISFWNLPPPTPQILRMDGGSEKGSSPLDPRAAWNRGNGSRGDHF